MLSTIKNLTFFSFVFTIGIALGAIYFTETITFSENPDFINMQKKLPQKKPGQLKFKTSKKKRYA